MSNPVRQGRGRALARDMGVTHDDVARRRRAVNLDGSDLPRIASVRGLVLPQVDGLVASFFEHLSRLDGAPFLRASRSLMERARDLKREHLVAMVGGEYGLEYAEQRLELAALYASVDLEGSALLGAFHHLRERIGILIMARLRKRPSEAFACFGSLERVASFDIGLIVDALAFEREHLIRQRAEAIREFSTPVLQIGGRLLLLPLFGVIDTLRARMIAENLLQAIGANRAKAVVMDVTGVATMDSKVADHIVTMVGPARVLGAHVIVAGLSSEVARSLNALGVDLSKAEIVGDLQGGLERGMELLGSLAGHARGSRLADGGWM